MLKKVYSKLLIFLASVKSRVIKKLLGGRVDALLVRTARGDFLVDPADLGVGGMVTKSGGYGDHEIARIESLTDKSSNVLFVGGHIGTIAIPIAETVHKVTVVEPNPKTHRLLKTNIAINGTDNIRTVTVAASDQKGEIEFVLNTTNSGGSKRMPIIKDYMYFYDNPEITSVPCDRLDDLVPEPVDLIVMDIEGSEYFALKGMPRHLSETQHLIIEFLPHHLRNVAAITVAEFLKPIENEFDQLFIPSRQMTVRREEFQKVLEEMYEADMCDEAMVFSKTR
ncbi:MAG: FkbM family methyltransferase [Filomicrobium sp.]